MRKEADDVGPKAELDYWKKRLARFDSLTACVKSPQCRNVVSILVAAKSKVLKVSRHYLIHRLINIVIIVNFTPHHVLYASL